MPEEPLDFIDVHARLDESRREGMPEIVEMKIVDPSLS
jgi:hypothetical protein